MANKIIRTLVANGYEAYLCGGYVRDSIIGRESKDIDITTSATPEQVKVLFDKTVDVGAAFGTTIVVLGEEKYEVTTFRSDMSDGRHPLVEFGKTAKEDAMRRDFTVNGLFQDGINGRIIDYVGGLEDIRSKTIRCIGDANKRFSEDPLRILRAARFSAELGFNIDGETAHAMMTLAWKLKDISSERIRDEITKGITGSDPSTFIKILFVTGLVQECIPEIFPMLKCEQSPEYHPEGDVITHTLLMLKPNASTIMAWAALLHDVGKPVDRVVDHSGKTTFFGHNETGADIAMDILVRLKFSNDDIDTITALIRNHMDHMNVRAMKNSTFKKYISRPTHDLEMELHHLDCEASNKDFSTYEYILERKKSIPANEVNPPALISGKDLIDAGIKPGPQFKEILHRIRNAQLDGVVSTKESAMLMARDIFLFE